MVITNFGIRLGFPKEGWKPRSCPWRLAVYRRKKCAFGPTPLRFRYGRRGASTDPPGPGCRTRAAGQSGRSRSSGGGLA